jgi:hypothetical protein
MVMTPSSLLVFVLLVLLEVLVMVVSFRLYRERRMGVLSKSSCGLNSSSSDALSDVSGGGQTGLSTSGSNSTERLRSVMASTSRCASTRMSLSN